jgi:hypothetical protein
MQLFGQINEPWNPYIELHINQPNINEPIFDVLVYSRDINGVANVITQFEDFPLPRGRWFNVSYYMKVDQNNGILRVWVDNILICDEGNQKLLVQNDDFSIQVAKIYYSSDDTVTHKLFVDDLEIYSIS